MGGSHETLRAPTKKELEHIACEWVRNRGKSGMEEVRWGWDPSVARKGGDGMWEITVWAHTGSG